MTVHLDERGDAVGVIWVGQNGYADFDIWSLQIWSVTALSNTFTLALKDCYYSSQA